MRKFLPGGWAALGALLGASASASAAATSPELQRCASIASAADRLACYDVAAGREGSGASGAPAPAPAAPAPVTRAPRAAAPAAPAPAPVAPPAIAPVAATKAAPTVAPPAAPAPAAGADPAEAAKDFGLSNAQRHAAPAGPSSIEAQVSQVTADRALRSLVVLDNGQTWICTDGGFDLVNGERVTIKRAALGSFMLISTTSKHSYHVRRVS